MIKTKMNKRGVSAVVATVLIILITVAAVTIIWAAVIPLVSDKIDTQAVCLDAISQLSIIDDGYTCIESGSEVNVHLKRGAQDFALADVLFLFAKSGEGETDSKSGVDDMSLTVSEFEVNEEITLTYSGAVDYEQVQIAPVISVGNNEVTCDVAAKVTLKAC